MLHTIKRKNHIKDRGMIPYENLHKFIRKFMGAASGYKNSFNPQFLTSSDRRVRQIDSLRDTTMLTTMENGSKCLS